MKPIHLVFPMSGQGTRYQKVGYKEPKPLIPVSGTPMIERLLAQFPQDWPCTFILAENHQTTDLPKVLKSLRPDSKIIAIPEHNEGPGRPLRAALDVLPENEPLLISYCDYSMIWDAKKFSEMVSQTGCDAALLSYIGFHAHYLSPVTYAYSRLEGDRVVEVKEKGSFTDQRENEYASSGAYYFKNKAVLREALDYQYSQGVKLNGEYYTSLTIQALLMKRPTALVKVFQIPYFFQWGTPEDLWDYEYWEKTYQAAGRGPSGFSVEQLLMPMAGLGSRFKALTKTPKPFISIKGQKIYERALHSLPKASVNAVVALKVHGPELRADLKAKLLWETPAGQALSTAEGLSLLNDEQPVLISACDHELYVSEKNWKRVQEQSPDAVIFTVKGFPGTRRNPKAFAYVQPENKDSLKVKSVAVKQPLSQFPSGDHLLVGTFWFKKAGDLRGYIETLVERRLQVNGELYLDSVFQLLLEAGKKVFLCEADGYINWGDPDSMAEALYWDEVFIGPRRHQRGRYPGVFE